MAKKVPMRDVIVLLPGITGSVLQKDGKDLWAISGQAIWQTFTSLGDSLNLLRLTNDDSNVDDLGDGIRAPRLMSDIHLVPGLVKIDGYSKIAQMIKDRFEVIHAGPNDEIPANFIEFPYDWRRDNRFTARSLKKLIDKKLPQWRAYSGATNAKIILVAHSMGGLVSRYYLEVLEGWENCKALITFGTPYRGSVNALNFLANGYKKLFIDLTEMMRTCTAIYQLLPIYEMLNVSGKYRRVAETDNVTGIQKTKAENALLFHREIENAVNEHEEDSKYRREGYKIIPIVGTRQPTFQSAEILDGRIKVSHQLPAWINSSSSDGDGTVPYFSAIPIELSMDYRETYISERHSSLQNNLQVLTDLFNRLQLMQIDLRAVRGSEPNHEVGDRPAISINLDDVYLLDEPIKISAQLLNLKEPPGALWAHIEQAGSGNDSFKVEFQEEENGWSLVLDHLKSGPYRLEVYTQNAGPQAPSPVHDVFEVAPKL